MRIKTVLSEAQNGQAYANLARAFHLPPTKVEDAVSDMLDALLVDIGERLSTRRALAKIVELLGRSDYERVLDDPSLLAATHTQVLGNEALIVLAGRKESNRLVRHAATVAGVSEMIAEYLLPVVAAMVIGALAKLCRPDLESIMGNPGAAGDAAASDPPPVQIELPRVSGGVGFSGSTGGAASVASTLTPESHYIELAQAIRRGVASDPADAVRRVLAPMLGLSLRPLGWFRRLSCWSSNALGAALGGLRR